MNGFRHDSHHTPAGGFRGGDSDGGGSDGRAHGGSYPPVAEIFASAAEKVNEMRPWPIGRLLEQGKTRLSSAKLRLDSRQNLAAAYWEFLVAFQITVDAIPRHPDYYDKIDQSRSQLHRDYRELTKDINTHQERFLRIKEIITNDNKRNGAQHSDSSSRPPSAASLYPKQTEIAAPPTKTSTMHRRDDELMLPDVPSTPPARPIDSPRRKPQVQPKPQSLHGRALHQSSSSVNGSINPNDLAERFAKLKGTAAPLETNGKDLSVKMPSPSEYHSSSRPLGPRDMPPPSYPTKPLLNTELAASMPKEPSPTYSPARNLALPESINPPRSSARSIVGTGGRSNSLQATSASAYPPHANGDPGSYFPTAPYSQPPAPAKRQHSISKASEDQISVEKFYDFSKMYNTLVIDVRYRTDFDAGHINRPSVICIEPTVLQDGCSASQLQDRLILSPDEEQAMFDRRDEYDLVVYYDAGTRTSAFLRQHDRTEKELALKRLYDSLVVFHDDKPLRRPPMFLMGGLDAWIEMLGAPGLKKSSTSIVVATKQTKPARTIRRVTGESHGDKLSIQKRRMREYMPMDPEEEQRWLEEARQGRVVFDPSEGADGDDDTLASPLYQSTEEFLRRFPEVDIEPQSMVHAPRRPPPPPQYVQPPVPTAPSRPAPSVSRVSYSGVHERLATPQSRSAQLPVYISPGRYGQIGLHKTGLVNFGVTCYMNSVVQCLCGNSDLVNIFLSRRYQKDLQKGNWKGTKGILSESFETLLSNLFKGDVPSCRPSTLRRVCGKFNSQWRIDEQQDAKEFLEFLLDNLHEDLNVTWNKSPLRQLTEGEELTRESLPTPYVARIEWNRYLHRENSMIGGLFAGQHASRLKCMTCGTTSTTYEAFWSISVEIPRDRDCDVRDCLRSYCAIERLSGDEVWRCPRCKREREAMKKITITRAPESLVIHFKRFSASHTERAQKVRRKIHFPLRGLDLGPFMEPPIEPEQEAQVMSSMMSKEDAAAQIIGMKTDPTMNGPFQYNAYAVIWHLGNTLGSGHYIANVRDKTTGVWRQFNDDRVTTYDAAQVQNRLQDEKAYIVFYERERVPGGVN